MHLESSLPFSVIFICIPEIVGQPTVLEASFISQNEVGIVFEANAFSARTIFVGIGRPLGFGNLLFIVLASSDNGQERNARTGVIAVVTHSLKSDKSEVCGYPPTE